MTWNIQQKALIEELIGIGRDVVSRKLTLASGGNLSVRDPGNPEQFIVTATETWFDKLVLEDFSLIDFEGKVIQGAMRPSSEWRVHARTYQARPEVQSVQHVHPQYSVLVDALRHKVRLLTLDHVSYVKNVETVPFNPNGSNELAESVAIAMAKANCVIMSHHGCAVSGETIASAYRRLLNLEEAAENTFRCLLVGNTEANFPINHTLSVHK